MTLKTLFRDATLLLAAGAIGWWAHGANATVRAASESPRDSSNLSFQFSGVGREESLALYSADNHTLYVYPTATGNSHVNCAYSIRVDRPGAPLEKENCGIGSALPR